MSRACVTLDHGSGGEASLELIRRHILARLDNPWLRPLDDSAVLTLPAGRVAFTSDSYVVDPLFFPGGDIGSLSVYGTVNDLAMQGARPLYLTLGLILEEGLSLELLDRVLERVSAACREAGVQVVTGDTKVVPRGHADKLFLNTAGVGIIPDGVDVGSHGARVGDVVLINGTVGDHGMAVLTAREGLSLEGGLQSDAAPLNGLVSEVIGTGAPVHVLRDPTRGGVATALNDIARESEVGIRLFEEAIPISPGVQASSELLGLDPLYVANEGKCLVLTPASAAEKVLKAMQRHPLGRNAALIGEVSSERPGTVLLKTRIGGTRILGMLSGEQLPRIC